MKLIYGEKSSKNRFTLISDAIDNGDSVKIPASTVSGIGVNVKFSEHAPVKYEAKLTAPLGDGAGTVFLGFRLTAPSTGANCDGLWLTVNGNRVGMRTGNWPEVTYTELPAGIDFRTERMLYAVDDPATNTVTLYTDGESGNEQKIATAVIDNCNIKLYVGENAVPSLVSVSSEEIPHFGHRNIWVHHISEDITISEIKVSGKEYTVAPVTSANMLSSRDVFEDTWVGTDNEGRSSGDSEKAPSKKKVGIFYFMWHNGTSSNPIYNHSAAYYSGGAKKLEEVITQGPVGFAHYWAEPYLGYYRSDDEWILRKHANQLTAAGIDFIFFDFTNGLIYERNLEALLSVWNKMRMEGLQVPKVAFHLGNTPSLSKSSFNALNSIILSHERYSDMWFKWEGKLLLLAPDKFVQSLDEETREKYTFRKSWAYTKGEAGEWYTSCDGKRCWPWADMYPQMPGKSESGETEQMIVMCGFWANGSYNTNGGRSYANGIQPVGSKDHYSFDHTYTTSGKGLGFGEQFNRAIEIDPELIMITGWNEWWAGRWEAGPALGQTIAGSYTVTENGPFTKNYFVDCFSPEYSRDIEPVKGLFNDNYYYQMTQNIRRFKGTRSPMCAFGQKTVDINGDISQWNSVGPEYRDYVGDTAHRDFMSYVGQIRYTNTTGRNDFITAKVSSDSEYFYFMAECVSDITDAIGTNWMNLFIDADANSSTGWYGYDYIINRSQNGSKCSVEKFNGTKWELSSAGEAEFSVNGRFIVIKIAKSTVPFCETFDFKWADNSVSDGDVMQFIDLGDTAPSERFNYRYTTAAQAEKLPDILTDSMTVLKAGSYNAYVGKKSVMLDPSNTNAVMMGTDNGVYLPKVFCENVLKLDVSGLDEKNHNGAVLVNVKDALNTLGKTVTYGENIIVVSDSEVSENDLLVLYRSLY